MISNPRHGWCSFKLGSFKGSPSYLTDVPIDLLDAFINYHTQGYGGAVFDEEGSYFTLVLTQYNLGKFIIEEKEDSKLHNLCDFDIEELEEELIADLEKDLDDWAYFTTSDDPKEIEQHKNEIEQRIAKLKNQSVLTIERKNTKTIS